MHVTPQAIAHDESLTSFPLPVTVPCPDPPRFTLSLTVIWKGNSGGLTPKGSPNATLAKVRMFDIVTVHLLLEKSPPSGSQLEPGFQRIGSPSVAGVATSTSC